MKKYIVWIVIFATLLIGISILVELKYFFLAKVIGFILVGLLTIMIRIWLTKAKKNFSTKPKFVLNANDKYDLQKILPIYNEWTSEDKKAFDLNLTSYLGVFDFDNFNHSTPNRIDCLAFCTLFCVLFPDDSIVLKRPIVVFKENVEIELQEVSNRNYVFVGTEYLFNQLKNAGSTDFITLNKPVFENIFKSFLK